MCSKLVFSLKLLLATALVVGAGRVLAAAKQTFIVNGIESRVFSGHSDRVTSASFSPNGRLIVTASADGVVRVWDVHTAVALRELRAGDDRFFTASFSPDGQLVEATSEQDIVYVWDVHTGDLKDHVEKSSLESFVLAKSPDGAVMVAAVPWMGAFVAHIHTNKFMYKLGAALSVDVAHFSHNGQLIAVVFYDELVRLVDTWTGNIQHTLMGHTASFSNDDQLVVTASHNMVRVWDVSTGNLRRVLTGHADMVLAASFSPDDTSIVTASCDRTARLWRDVQVQNRNKAMALVLATARIARLGQHSPAQLLQSNTLEYIVSLAQGERFAALEQSAKTNPGMYARALATASQWYSYMASFFRK